MTILSTSTISEYRMETLESTPILNYHYDTAFIVDNAVKF